MQVNKGPYMAVLPSHSFFSATAICIAAGAIILVVGFCGCCGSLIENKTMLIVVRMLHFVIYLKSKKIVWFSDHLFFKSEEGGRLFLAQLNQRLKLK